MVAMSPASEPWKVPFVLVYVYAGFVLWIQVGRGMKVMHRHDTDTGQKRSAADPRIAHIREVSHAVDRQMVNVSVEGLAHLRG